MISVNKALDLILAETSQPKQQWTHLSNAAGRYLAEPACASHDAPPCDNAAMDGFAVHGNDLALAGSSAPVRLPIQGEISAGATVPTHLESGKVWRINTGAPLPEGADAVVQIEHVETSDSHATFTAPARPGLNIRRAGEDFRLGQTLIESGWRLDARAIGVLASLGIDRIAVHRRPRVALLSSGDEIIEPGLPLEFGQIYNSSGHALPPLLEAFGAEVHDLGQVGDTLEETRAALERGLAYDMLVTTGGVSMGSRDFIRPALMEIGAREVFWKVSQKPGKPIFLAKHDSTLCFGLPGNPISVFVTALIYVRAAVLKFQGASQVDPPWRAIETGADFKASPSVTVFARADLNMDNPSGATPKAIPSTRQGSHQFSSLITAAGLVRLEPGAGTIPAGALVDFLEFDRLF